MQEQKETDLVRTLISIVEEHPHLANRDESQVTNIVPISSLRQRFRLEFPTLPHSHEELIDLVKMYLEHSTRLHSPRFMSHQVAIPSTGSTLADIIQG